MIITQGDTFPNPSADLNANIAGATVTFRLKKTTTGAFVLTGSAVIDDAASGLVHYDWGAGQTDALLGMYQGVFRVVYAGGDVQTFPQDSRLEIVVRPAVPAA